jgi:leader peptidase (prepilin peptidase)/N-methyltransferase
MVILILALLGVCLGSFINAFVWRHYKLAELKEAGRAVSRQKKKAGKQPTASELSITTGRSMCTHCHHPLAAKDLIPVVSYLWLRGKCRYCGKPIEDTPLAELLTPLLFVLSYVFWPDPLTLTGGGLFMFVGWLVFVVGLVALILYDLRWFLLPHNIVLPLIGLASAYDLVQAFVFGGGVAVLTSAFWGALVIGGLFYALYKISNEQWIGGGDITLGVLLGLLVGGPSKAFLLIFIASFLGTLIAVPLLALKRATRTTHLPFGPFLILAACIVMLFGTDIIGWYTGSFTDWLNGLFGV